MALARVILGMVYFVYDYQRIIARLRLTIVKVGKENLSEESTLNSRKNLTKQLTLLLKAEKDRNELAANYSSKYVQL